MKYCYSLLVCSGLFIFAFVTTNATNYYINDGSSVGNVFCDAGVAGNAANAGNASNAPTTIWDSITSKYTLAADDTVFIDVGTYSWTTTYSIRPNASGTSGNEIVIMGAGSSNTEITSAGGTNSGFYVEGNDYIIVRDLKMINSGGSQPYFNFNNCCGNDGATNITFRDCIIENDQGVNCIETQAEANNLTFRGCTITNSVAGSKIINMNADDVAFEVCTLSYNTTAFNGGMTVNGSVSSFTVDSCTITQSGTGEAFYINSPTAGTISNSTITTTGNGAKAFFGFNSTNLNITDNVIDMTTGNGSEIGIHFQTSSTGLSIQRNWIKGGGYGVKLDNAGAGGDGKIYNNSFANNTIGVDMAATASFDVYYNTFRNSEYCLNGTFGNSAIKNNIFATEGNSSFDAVKFSGTSAPASGDMDYNAYYFPNGANPVEYNGTNYDALTGGTNNWNDVLGDNDDNSLDNVDPIFMGAADENLSLHTSTPLANLGVDLSPTVTDDIWGAARDATPFIGAYETSAGSILPVEWAYFNGSCAGGNILLEWGTHSEINNDHFEVVYSEDGKSEEVLDRVWGAGTSSIDVHYRWIEESEDGLYRLQQRDYDGQGESTDWIHVSCATGHGFNLLKAREMFNNLYVQTPLDTEVSGQLEIFNSQGQLVKTKARVTVGAGSATHVTISDLSTGVYWVFIRSDQQQDLVTSFSKQ